MRFCLIAAFVGVICVAYYGAPQRRGDDNEPNNVPDIGGDERGALRIDGEVPQMR